MKPQIPPLSSQTRGREIFWSKSKRSHWCPWTILWCSWINLQCSRCQRTPRPCQRAAQGDLCRKGREEKASNAARRHQVARLFGPSCEERQLCPHQRGTRRISEEAQAINNSGIRWRTSVPPIPNTKVNINEGC